MRALWFAIRSSGLWAVIAVLSALAALVMQRSPSYAVGSWLAAGAHGDELAFFLSPFAAATAAWTASVGERAGLDEQLSAAAKSRWRIDSVALVAVVCTALVPYIVGHAVGFALTARTFPPGLQWWLRYLVLGAATLVLAVAIGWLFGRLFPPIWSVVAAAVLTLAWQMYAPTKSGILVASGEPWEGPALSALVVRCVLAAGLIVGSSCLAFKRNDQNRRGRFVAAGLVSMFAVTLFSVQQSHVIALRVIPDDPTCTGEAVTVCLWPEDERQIALVEWFDPRLHDLPPVLALPDTVYQYGLLRSELVDGAGKVHIEPTGFDISETNRWSYAMAMSEEIGNEILEACPPIDGIGEYAFAGVVKWIEFRLMRSVTPDYRVSGAPPDMEAAWDEAKDVTENFSESDQFVWVVEKLETVVGADCPLLQQ